MKKNEYHIIFENDYRIALKHRQNELKSTLGKDYSLSTLANIIRVQRPYLSKVFALQADLSEDQLYLAFKYLKFSQHEEVYLRLLHAQQRSGLPERKKILAEQLKSMRDEYMRADRRMETPTIESDNANESLLQKYFLDVNVQLVHMFLTIEKFQKDYNKIIQALNLPTLKWQDILNTLIDLRLVDVRANEIVPLKEHLMLPKDSPALNAYHTMAKSNSAQRLMMLPNNQKNSFSMVFTCNPKTANLIRLKLIDFITESESLIKKDLSPDQVYQLSLDLFPWT